MLNEKLDQTVLRKLGLPFGEEPDLDKWKEFLTRLKNPKYIQPGSVLWENMLNFLMHINQSLNLSSMPDQ